MKMILSFVKLVDGTIHVGLSETTDDRFAHGEGLNGHGDLVEFAIENSIQLPCDVTLMWSDIKGPLERGASLIEYIVDADE